MKEIIQIIGIIFVIFTLLIILVVGVVSSISFGSQWLDKNTWGSWEYRVSVDDTYFYTNDYELTGNCIVFVNNYGDNKKYCEKFRVGENYWFDNSPNWKTVLWGTE